MAADPRRVKELFVAALEVADSKDRNAFLDRECAGAADLRHRLDVLLAAHDHPDSAVDKPLAAAPPQPGDSPPANRETITHRTAEVVGTIVAGRYKLLEEIGLGGMGNVWMAEQRDPVKRLVALKLIKPGMDSRAVLARFEAERQALALMDHPNIAKVLDGGTTEAGRPFFVMELVKGLPLTDYCDDRRLSVRERLDLFVQVCSAVQHAHQKGVIHRDLKPSNILVTEHDGKPMPKVIDFGLAKALNASNMLTERTLHTAYGTVVGTPLYMAPEQVGINALDVDTRTDIYALGVILYELLTGTTPLQKKQLKEAAWEEIRRLIREEEAPRPSTRLSTSDALPSLAARRQTEPAKLSGLVRGELDWIVLKALEKDRNRRYETANGLAMDVQRHLADEPVLACPPTASYRLRKFVRKHRGPVLAAATLLFVLTVGVVGATFGLVWVQAERQRAEAEGQRALAAEAAAMEQARLATQERDRAELARDRAERAADAERQAKQSEAASRWKAMDALQAPTDDLIEQVDERKAALGPAERAFLEKQLTRLQSFAAEAGSDEQARAIRAKAARQVAYLRLRLDQEEQARAGYGDAIAQFSSLAADFPANGEYLGDLADCQRELGRMLRNLGKQTEAEAMFRQSLSTFDKVVQNFPAVTSHRVHQASAYVGLGVLLDRQRRQVEAAAAFRQALTIQEKLAAEFPALPKYRQDLGNFEYWHGKVLADLGKRFEAEAAYRRALASYDKLVTEFPAIPGYRRMLAQIHNNFRLLLSTLAKREEAEASDRQALALRTQLVAEFPEDQQYRRDLAQSQRNMAFIFLRLGQHPEAIATCRESIAILEKLTTEAPAESYYRYDLARSYERLGMVLADQGSRSEAEEPCRKSLAILERLVEDFPAFPDYRQELGKYYLDLYYVLWPLGKKSETEAACRQAVAVNEKLLAQFPGDRVYGQQLVQSLDQLATFLNYNHKPKESLVSAEKQFATLQPFLQKGAVAAWAQQQLSTAHERRAEALTALGRQAESSADWDKAFELAPVAQRARIRMSRALSRVRFGPAPEALREVDELLPDANSVTLYNAACGYALAAAHRDDPAGNPPGHADRAMALLRQAVAKGWKDVEQTKRDDDLAALRGREDFRQLIAEMERSQTPKKEKTPAPK